MKILKRYDRKIISSVALRCSDEFFKDFIEPVYAQAVYEAQEELARKYKLLHRIVKITVEKSDLENRFVLPFTNFDSETSVKVNNVKLTRAVNIDNEYTYFLEYRNNVWEFDYYGKSEDDEIEIEYVSTGDMPEEQDGSLVIPEAYYYEVIRRAVKYISKLGIPKYDNELSQKYTKLYRLYSKEGSAIELESVRGKTYNEIKLFDGIS